VQAPSARAQSAWAPRQLDSPQRKHTADAASATLHIQQWNVSVTSACLWYDSLWGAMSLPCCSVLMLETSPRPQQADMCRAG
jgi:hypothetical protein